MPKTLFFIEAQSKFVNLANKGTKNEERFPPREVFFERAFSSVKEATTHIKRRHNTLIRRGWKPLYLWDYPDPQIVEFTIVQEETYPFIPSPVKKGK